MVFKTRFIYPLFLVFLLFAVAMSIVVLWFYFWFVPSIFFKEGFHIDNLGMAAAALLLFGYPAAQFVYITLTLRYGVKIIDNSIVLKDFLFWRERNITGKIRGYNSSFAGNYQDIKCIIIYLEDGRHINLPRYMYLNYMDIEPALKQYGLTFLGTEPYNWKYIVARGYAYDNSGNFKQNA